VLRAKEIKKKQERTRKWGKIIFASIVLLAIFNITTRSLFPHSQVVYYFSKFSLSIFMLLSGFAHFMLPQFFKSIIPYFFPLKDFLVYSTGIFEVLLGVLYGAPGVSTSLLNLTSWLLIVFLLAIFPANINCAVSSAVRRRLGFSHRETLIRLPIQLVFIFWAYLHTTRSFLETFF